MRFAAIAVILIAPLLAADPKPLTIEQRLANAKAEVALVAAENRLHRIHAQARAAIEKAEAELRKSEADHRAMLEKLRAESGASAKCNVVDDAWKCAE